jgi:uncharacterized membrane protein YebE (DUF533 family)
VLSIVTTAAAAAPGAEESGSTALALFVLIIVAGGWMLVRMALRRMRAGKVRAKVAESFSEFALHALVNAAKLDGRVNDAERRAVVVAMREVDGAAFEAVRVEERFAKPSLSKDELIAYLQTRAHRFTRDQKASLIRALVSVFVSDGKFDEDEHAALIDYTAAIGFDRDSAPEMLRSFARGSMT